MQQGAQVQRSSALTITRTLVHFGNTRVTSPGHSADQMCPFPQWICRSRAEEKRTLLPGQCRLNLGNPSDRKVNISTFSVFISVEYQPASNKQLWKSGKLQWPVAHVQFSFTVGQHIFVFWVAHCRSLSNRAAPPPRPCNTTGCSTKAGVRVPSGRGAYDRPPQPWTSGSLPVCWVGWKTLEPCDSFFPTWGGGGGGGGGGHLRCRVRQGWRVVSQTCPPPPLFWSFWGESMTLASHLLRCCCRWTVYA